MIFKERKEFTFVSKALPEDAFSVVKFSGVEAISRPYQFDITVASRDPEIDLKAVLQNPATLSIVHGGEDLPFHGVLAGFEQLHEVKQHAFYRAILVPKLWNAGLYRQNQVFLDKTVPQIIEEILKQTGMSGPDYALNLTRSYPAWEHICQYQETDLDFINRWMEREGIFYFFEQTGQGAKMILSDSLSIHKDIPGDADIAYSPPSGLMPADKEIVREFVCRQKALPAKVILKDYNYRRPGLEVKAEAEVDSRGRGDVCIYGEHFKDPEQGKELAKIRAEELLCRELEFHGEGTAPAFCAGFTFTLSGHYRSGYNRKYLITEAAHAGSRAEDFLAGLGGERSKLEEEAGYSNRFVCIPADVQFRPERRTPKPKFYGSMNAAVDAAGDGKYAELDDQGRYKVILPFDLSGRKDGKASRFVRMAQPYSGFTATDGIQGPSGMHFPLHKGAEVLLTFVDGDPDRPVISHAIPNPETVSPVVQGNQTQSVIRDNYGNELIFDSTPGDEHIRLYSPHHNSGLELGRSIWNWTKSNDSEITLGNKWGFVNGNTVDFKLGNFFEAKVGQIWDIWAGFRTDVALGGKLTFDWSYDVGSHHGPIIETTTADILSAAGKDHVLTAGDQVCIIGGEAGKPSLNVAQKEFAEERGLKGLIKLPPKDENRSIVNVFPERLILSVGRKSDTKKFRNKDRKLIGPSKEGEIFTKSPPKKALILPTVLPILLGMYSKAEAAMTDAGNDSIMHSSGANGESHHWSDWLHSGDGIVGGVAGIVSCLIIKHMLKEYIGDEAVEPVGQEDPAAKMELDHEGKVLVNSKAKSVVIRVGENDADGMRGSGLLLEKDWVLLGKDEFLHNPKSQNSSRLKMEKSGNVFLVAKNSNVIKAEGTIQMQGKAFHGPGGNLKILK